MYGLKTDIASDFYEKNNSSGLTALGAVPTADDLAEITVTPGLYQFRCASGTQVVFVAIGATGVAISDADGTGADGALVDGDVFEIRPHAGVTTLKATFRCHTAATKCWLRRIGA